MVPCSHVYLFLQSGSSFINPEIFKNNSVGLLSSLSSSILLGNTTLSLNVFAHMCLILHMLVDDYFFIFLDYGDTDDLLTCHVLSSPLFSLLFALSAFQHACCSYVDDSINGDDSRIVAHFVVPNECCISISSVFIIIYFFCFVGSNSYFIFIFYPASLMQSQYVMA